MSRTELRKKALLIGKKHDELEKQQQSFREEIFNYYEEMDEKSELEEKLLVFFADEKYKIDTLLCRSDAGDYRCSDYTLENNTTRLTFYYLDTPSCEERSKYGMLTFDIEISFYIENDELKIHCFKITSDFDTSALASKHIYVKFKDFYFIDTEKYISPNDKDNIDLMSTTDEKYQEAQRIFKRLVEYLSKFTKEELTEMF